MSDLGVALSQTRYSLVSLSRNKRAVLFTVLLPIFLLVLFASVFGSGDVTDVRGLQIDLDAYYTAGIIAYALTSAAFTTLAISLTTMRESGVLKRFRGTPIPGWTFIVAQILRSLVLVVLMVVVLGIVARFAFGVDFQADTVGGLLVYIVLGTATMCVLGIALTAITTTAESASTIAPFGILILSFVSGVFIPTDELPDWLVEIGRVFPLAHLAEGLQAALSPSTAGSGLSAENVAILAGWGVVGLVVAVRLFRWEPQAARG